MKQHAEIFGWLAGGLMCLAGCGAPATDRAEPGELPLVLQAEAVRAGKSDGIVVDKQPLHDGDLAVLAGLTGLRVLLLDSEQSSFTADGFQRLAGLTKLEHMRFRGSGVDDSALKAIAALSTLKILNLPRGSFTDEGLAQLQSLPQLVQLRFGSPHVTDAGMKTIAELPSLKRLHLIDVPITDEGLRALAGMEQLESLYIDGGSFSDAALDEFFRARPKLHVHLNQEHHDRDPSKHTHP